MNAIISFTIPSYLKRRLDRIRGDVPRSKFIGRLLESYIDNEDKRSTATNKNRLENINPPKDIFQVEQ